jgi:hypothetical protein
VSIVDVPWDRHRYPSDTVLLAEAGLAPVTPASGRSRSVVLDRRSHRATERYPMHDDTDTEASLLEALRDRGMRATLPRRAICQFLARTDGAFLTAPRSCKALPRVSAGSTLRRFTEPSTNWPGSASRITCI